MKHRSPGCEKVETTAVGHAMTTRPAAVRGCVIVRIRFNEALLDKPTARDLIEVAGIAFQGIGYDLKTGLRDSTWFGQAESVDVVELRRQVGKAARRRGVVDVNLEMPAPRP